MRYTRFKNKVDGSLPRIRLGKLVYKQAQQPSKLEDLRRHIQGPEKAPEPQQEKKEDVPEAQKKEEAPPKVEAPKKDKALEDAVKALESEEARAAIGSYMDTAEKLMNRFKVQFRGLAEDKFFLEEDGVDVIYDVSTANLEGAVLLFDFSSNLGLKQLRKVWEDPATTFLTGGAKLNEVVFHFCEKMGGGERAAFGAVAPQAVQNLLAAVGVLQAADLYQEQSREKLPTEDAANKLDWAMEVANEISSRHENILVDQIQSVLKAAKEDVNAGNLGADEFKALQDTLKGVGQKAWAALWDKNEQAIKMNRYKPSRELIAETLRTLTRNQYKGDFATAYKEDGMLEVAIEAPYPFYYRFDRQPTKLVFKLAAMANFCGHTYATTNEAMAYPLLMADVNLARAYQLGANPGVSKERSGPLKSEEDLENELARLIIQQQWQERQPMEEEVARVKAIIEKTPQRFFEWVRNNRDAAKRYVTEHLTPWFKDTHPRLFNTYEKALIGEKAPA